MVVILGTVEASLYLLLISSAVFISSGLYVTFHSVEKRSAIRIIRGNNCVSIYLESSRHK
jgi:hypothetical protein